MKKKHFKDDAFTHMTATNLFIRPVLHVKKEDEVLHGLENVYIKDEVRGIDYERGVYFLFRPMKMPEFAHFVERERKRGVLIDEYDYPEGWVVLVYQYPEQYTDDVQLVLEGKYSQVSGDYKYQIPDKAAAGTYGEKMSIQHHIINKTSFIKQYIEEIYGIEIDDDVEHWRHYPEREILTQEVLNNLI